MREHTWRTTFRTLNRTDVWLPLAGMAVFLSGDFDEDVSDWAVDGNPLFGSDSTARSFSNVGRDLLRYSSLATSSFKKGKGTGRLQFDRKGAKEWLLTWSSAQIMTASLKAAVGRERPDMENNRSFPSGHSSGALVSASILRRNLDNGSHLRAYDGARSLLNFGICSLAGAVAWARVEGEKHYPSDVLAGAAIGNAFGNFYFDLFPLPQTKKPDAGTSLSFSSQNGDLVLTLHSRF